MVSPPLQAIATIWAAWAVSWFLAALWSARTVRRPPIGSQFLYRVVTTVGVVMLFGSFQASIFRPSLRLWPHNETFEWAMAALTAAGFLFTWWARIHLGRLWSGFVAKKTDHHVVDTGPYALVRHPIYTGIILSSFAAALGYATAGSLAGACVMTLGWYIKARLEERFLRQELDARAYDAYAARVPMLIPFAKI